MNTIERVFFSTQKVCVLIKRLLMVQRLVFLILLIWGLDFFLENYQAEQ